MSTTELETKGPIDGVGRPSPNASRRENHDC